MLNLRCFGPPSHSLSPPTDLFFYDKLEKANFYLENMLDLVEEPLDSRLIQYLNETPENGEWREEHYRGTLILSALADSVHCGYTVAQTVVSGTCECSQLCPLVIALLSPLYRLTPVCQHIRAVNLVQKYGLVPQTLFPETYNSSNSGKVNSLITSKVGFVPLPLPLSRGRSHLAKHGHLLPPLTAQLREYSLELRGLFCKTMQVLEETTNKAREEQYKVAIAACRSRKAEQMSEIYTILAMTVGQPPRPDEKLTYEYYDKDKKFRTLEMTPLEFYKALEGSFKAEEAISLINDPRNPLDKLYTVQRLGNVWGARPVLYVNTENEVLEDMIVKMLKADLPVW